MLDTSLKNDRFFTSTRQANAYIKSKGFPFRLICGNGYLWFIDETSIEEPPKSIYVCHLNQVKAYMIDESIQQWVDEKK